MRSKINVILAMFLLLPAVALAFPIAAPGTEGLRVIVSGTGNVIATYEGNSATYSNDLYVGLNVETTNIFVFNNHSSPPGAQVDLGSFPIGTELVFRLHVNNTGRDFYTGPAERNPDNRTHARVQGAWLPDVTLVSFEDLFNGPFNFNDLSFSFSNTDNCVVICDAGGPYSGEAGVPVQFDGSGSITSPGDCGDIASYEWQFGDGGTGSGATPTHTYAADGVYQVSLCVTDNHGHTSCCSPQLVVPSATTSWGSLKAIYR
ncbi:MAG: PKD domain-containing protein [Deltaproteobacteria bacterium]|nr:PKD domain-containing protein [Deltaproteobacteria bacterium]